MRFAGSFEAAKNASGGLPKVTLEIGTGEIHPSVRYACEYGRGGSGPLGQNPGAGNNPFGTQYVFGAFRGDNGGCGFTFAPDARVSYWVAQPTGPSVPLNIYGYADTYGELELRYNTLPLLNACPVNLCAFAMNASSDNSYILVAPFNLTRPAPAGSQSTAAASITVDEAPITIAQTGSGGVAGVARGSDGSLLNQVLVLVTDPQEQRIFGATQTDVLGRYSIPSGLPSGSYVVSFLTGTSGDPNTLRFAGAGLSITVTEPYTAVLDATLQLGSTISGRVTAEGGTALPEVPVWIYDAALAKVVSVTSTDASGNYTSDALPSGSYVVQFDPASSGFDPSTGYVGEYHNEQPLGTAPTPVTVAAPAPLAGVNGTLARCATCGAIDGRVTARDNGAPLPDVTVVIRNAANGQQVAIETTDETGRYHVLLPSGSYTVEFFTDVSPLAQTRAYADGFASPNAIAVTAPAVVANINGVLARGGQIAGRVTAQDGGAGLDGVVVAVSSANGQGRLLTTAITDADGRFTTPALANGSYTLTFETEQSPTETTRAYGTATRTVSLSGPGVKDGTNVTLSR